MTTLTILKARLICPATGMDAVQDLHVQDGKIVALGSAPVGFKADLTLDGKDCVLAPGLIDLSVRLREPGYEYKNAMHTELQAAVAGGVTTVVCPPDTDPVLDLPGLVEMLRQCAAKIALAKVLPLGALTVQLKGEDLTEMATLTESGCVGFSQGGVPLANTQVLSRALSYARSFNFPVWLRPTDARLAGGVAASGAYATRMGLAGVPVAAESIALLTLFELLRSNPTPVHIQCLSSARGVELVRAAKAEGLPISCDVSAYHLHLCDTDIGHFNPQMRFEPPLRSSRDRSALRAALADGTIDAVCSDHTPMDDDEKLVPFAQARAGASGVELLLGMALQWAQQDKVSLPALLARLTTGAARALRRPAPSLSLGASADLVLFKPDAWQRIGTLKSQGQNTPFAGMELPGVVQATVVGGRVVYRG
jgi:dihydroorotase